MNVKFTCFSHYKYGETLYSKIVDAEDFKNVSEQSNEDDDDDDLECVIKFEFKVFEGCKYSVYEFESDFYITYGYEFKKKF